MVALKEEKEKIQHERRKELLRKMLRDDGENQIAFNHAESFSLGYLVEIEDGEKKVYLMNDVHSGSLDEIFSQIEHYADREEMIGLVFHDKEGKVSGSIVVQRNWDDDKSAHVGIGYCVMLGVDPIMLENYKSKPERVKQILVLLETFGTLGVSKFGNTRRNHHATYLADEAGNVVCGIFANGSDYRTPSLQEVAETMDLTDWVLEEPFGLIVAYNSRKDIIEALIKKGKELNIKISTSGGFSI